MVVQTRWLFSVSEKSFFLIGHLENERECSRATELIYIWSITEIQFFIIKTYIFVVWFGNISVFNLLILIRLCLLDHSCSFFSLVNSQLLFGTDVYVGNEMPQCRQPEQISCFKVFRTLCGRLPMPKHTNELSHNDDNINEKKENTKGLND